MYIFVLAAAATHSHWWLVLLVPALLSVEVLWGVTVLGAFPDIFGFDEAAEAVPAETHHCVHNPNRLQPDYSIPNRRRFHSLSDCSCEDRES
jgi:hypothetical protein